MKMTLSTPIDIRRNDSFSSCVFGSPPLVMKGYGIIKKIFLTKKYGFIVVTKPVTLNNSRGDEAHFNFSDLKLTDPQHEKRLIPGWGLTFLLEKQAPARQSKFCDYKAVRVVPEEAMVMNAKIIEGNGTHVTVFCDAINRTIRISKQRVNSDAFARDEKVLVKILWDDLPFCEEATITGTFASSMKFHNIHPHAPPTPPRSLLNKHSARKNLSDDFGMSCLSRLTLDPFVKRNPIGSDGDLSFYSDSGLSDGGSPAPSMVDPTEIRLIHLISPWRSPGKDKDPWPIPRADNASDSFSARRLPYRLEYDYRLLSR